MNENELLFVHDARAKISSFTQQTGLLCTDWWLSCHFRQFYLSLSLCIVSIIFHQRTHFLFSAFAILLSTFLHNLASSTSNRRHQFGFLFIFSVLHVYSTCSIVFYVFVYGISISEWLLISIFMAHYPGPNFQGKTTIVVIT